MPTFFICPQTGFQIRTDIDIDDDLRKMFPAGKNFWGMLWEYAARNQNAITEALRDNTAVFPEEEALWLCVPGKHGMYYRIRKDVRERYTLDMAINTNLCPTSGRNFATCTIPVATEKNLKNVTQFNEIARFDILPRNEVSSMECDLIIDFGNTGTTAGFVSSGDSKIHRIPINNPWDPKEFLLARNEYSDRQIFHSNQLLFRLDTGVEPAESLIDSESLQNEDNCFLNKLWWISGTRANEIAKNISQDTTYIFSPKKFVRKWTQKDDSREPRITLCGIMGGDQVRDQGYRSAPIIKEALRSQLGLIISSFVNPRMGQNSVSRVPRFNRVLLSYPLTWRKKDKEFFRTMVNDIFHESYNSHLTPEFNVEMSFYNEPYCVVAYLVNEIIKKFGGRAGNWEMVRSIMGNFDKDTNESRILVVDIGGGSTDIALVDVGLTEEHDKLGCKLDLKSTMRFNRAGDRISHIIATIIWEHIRRSRNLRFKLCVGAVTDDNYRRILRKLQLDIMQLSENVKRTLAMGQVWRWRYPDEKQLLSTVGENVDPLIPLIRSKNKILDNIKILLDSVSRPVIKPGDTIREDEKFLMDFEISNEIVGRCIEEDKFGLYEIFISLKRLVRSLKMDDNCMPDRIILSGRTSKLPCVKTLLNKVFNHIVPSYRIMSLEDFIPSNLRDGNFEHIEKLAVMLGIHKFRTGHLAVLNTDPNCFHRFIGPVIYDDELGDCLAKRNGANWILCSDFIKPGSPINSCLELLVRPGSTVRIGQSFSEKGFAEVIGEFSVKDMSEAEREQYCEGEYYRVTIILEDDYSVKFENDNNPQSQFVKYTDNIPGGIEPVDNFCYDGMLDADGTIKNIVADVYPRLK